MSTETVLSTEVLAGLRSKNIITTNEVAISVGDIFYAKDVLTNEKRIISADIVSGILQNDTLRESANKRSLLKG